jgi:hypothetical protein
MTKVLLLATAFACVSSLASASDTFTFTGTNTTTSQIVIANPGGRPSVGATGTGTGELVYSSGAKVTTTAKCISASTEPANPFPVRGVCETTTSDGGKAGVAFTCTPIDPKTGASSCWAGLTGTAGKYNGKSGTASWHNTQSADKKSSTSVGTGQWN